MGCSLAVAAAGGVAREATHPFYDGPVDALVHWAALLPFGLLMAYVLVAGGRRHAGVLASGTARVASAAHRRAARADGRGCCSSRMTTVAVAIRRHRSGMVTSRYSAACA